MSVSEALNKQRHVARMSIKMAEPYELSNQFITVNGIDFHYALDGNPDRPVLALINMASNNLTCWEVVLDGLLEKFHVLRFDIRGTGKSGWGSDDEFTFSHYADDLAGIMQALDISKAFVLGVAYGARTAAQFALRHPDRLTALGLFDVALTPPVAQTGQRALGAEARKLLELAGERAVAPRKSWRFYENRDAALKAHTAHECEPDTSQMLGGLPIPVLIACGRQDMNLEQAQRIAASIPGCECQIMEMTGHGSPFFRPGLFVELVNGFLTAV
jgi:pimeloyl-ACP methyl ester carboxylesterase